MAQHGGVYGVSSIYESQVLFTSLTHSLITTTHLDCIPLDFYFVDASLMRLEALHFERFMAQHGGVYGVSYIYLYLYLYICVCIYK